MKKYSLQFPSLIYLTAFRKFSKAADWEINITDMVAHCDCSDKEARYACKEFKAILLKGGEELIVTRPAWEINASPFPRHIAPEVQ